MSAGRIWLPALRYLQQRTDAYESVLRAAGLDAAAVEDLEARVPLAAGCNLLREAALHLREPLFGLHAAGVVRRATFGIIELVVASQPDRASAFASVSRLAPLAIESLRMTLETDGEESVFRLDLHDEPIRDPHLAEYALGLAHAAQRAIVDLSLLRIEFPHPPRGPRAAYRRWFDAPVAFEAERCCAVFPARQSGHFKTADPTLATLLERQASAQLAKLPATRTYSSRVRSLLRARLGLSPIGIEDAAAALKMSERTLRRRLAAESVSFADVLEAYRREVALERIEDPRISIDALSLELGYASPGAFRRAFQRWTGESPRSYRARRRVIDG